jgi:hypothetical protein
LKKNAIGSSVAYQSSNYEFDGIFGGNGEMANMVLGSRDPMDEFESGGWGVDVISTRKLYIILSPIYIY